MSGQSHPPVRARLLMAPSASIATCREAPRRLTLPARGTSLSMAAAIVCIALVALDLRPGIVSTGPLLPTIIHEFGLSHTQAALLTAIPTLLMGLLAAPVPWLSRRYGRDRVMFAALALLTVSSLLVSYTLAAIGPLALGQLPDASGSFRSSLWLLVAVSSVMVAATPFLQPRQRKGAIEEAA
jgi:CP family cyanate transporter-like MFS transporter